jgi:hypothetical protein
MKISPSKAILAISLLANVGLAIQILLLNYSNRINVRFYRYETGNLIERTHSEISKGNIEQTLEVLKAIPWSPEYKDLTKAVDAFVAMNNSPPQAEQEVVPPNGP